VISTPPDSGTVRPVGSSDEGPPTERRLRSRGGAQVIPRPASIREGAPPPWADLAPAERRITLAQVHEAFAAAPQPLLSPLEGTGVRASAVLAALYEVDGSVHVVLTRRAQHMRSHRGEVSFPGGGQDPGEDLRATALREAWEEVGLDPADVEIIGELDHLQTVTSRSFIVPYVAVLPGRPAFPVEVELILHVALEELLDPQVFREERWGVAPLEFAVQFFEIPGDTVWGATGRMLRNMLGVITGTPWRDDDTRWPRQQG
jgi:8-oxo-dGTP pyrophosphatase MutT (NUDIX family)